MIENKLTFAELSNIIRPFLRLETATDILQSVQRTLDLPATSLSDYIGQRKILVTYEGYQVEFMYIGRTSAENVIIRLQFKAIKKWWHGLKDQNARIISDLKKICINEIKNLQFYQEEVDIRDQSSTISGEDEHYVYHVDARAIVHNWMQIHGDISPLIIAPDAHHGKCFIEFQFNPSCYCRSGHETILRDDWAKHFFTIITPLDDMLARTR